MTEINPQTPETLRWWQRLRAMLLSKRAVRIYWVINISTLLGTLAWILQDGKFAEGAAAFSGHLSALWGDGSPLAVVPPLLWPRVDALWLVLIMATLSALGIAVALFAGAGMHRGTRSWLAVMLVLAGWLTLATTWPEIAWRGQAWRIRGSIDQFDTLSEQLLKSWPQGDGEITGLGPFMAYPIGKPRTLMFLTSPNVPGTSLTISTVERGEHDDLHFELSGNDEGVWVVRDIKAEEPQSFFSGLEGEYIPMHYKQLQSGWFLVKYMYAPTVMGDPGTSRQRQ